MKRPHDDELRANLKEAHEPTKRGAPEFEALWQKAESDAAGTGSGEPGDSGDSGGLSGAVRLALAAALVLISVAGAIIVADSSDRPTKTVVTETSRPEAAQAQNDDGTRPFAEYDILDWEPSTDVLLAHDDSVLDPPALGRGAWDESNGWIELTDRELEEL